MSPQPQPIYEFGPFRLDTVKRVLLREGEPVPLTSKVFDTLLVLVQHDGQLLTKDELMQMLWPDSIVEESNLTQNISVLRKALGESPDAHRYIVTVPGRGYKFVAGVSEVGSERVDLIVTERARAWTVVEEEERGKEWGSGRVGERESVSLTHSPILLTLIRPFTHSPIRPFLIFVLVGLAAALSYFWLRSPSQPTGPLTTVKSIAVLPFKPLSVDQHDEYLGLGMADTLITKLSNLRQLIVRPTSAVRKYTSPEQDPLAAGREQQVDMVLEGSIQRSGEKVRVTVRLLSVKDRRPLWAHQCDEQQCTDIFALQDLISEQVASKLQLALTSSERARLTKRYTMNPEAYEYYLKGQAHLERHTTAIGDFQPVESAIQYFKKAVELDPKYALAYAALAEGYMWMANFNDPDNPVWVGLAQQALAQAESLDPQLAEIHTVRWQYYFSKYGGWDLERAAQEVRQALALNPGVGHDSLAVLYDHVGFEEPALRAMQRALETDPTNTFTQARFVESYTLLGKFDEAIEAQRRFFGQPGPAVAFIGKNRLDEAQALLEKALARTPGDFRARSELALVLALKGRFQEAEARIPEILEESRNNRAYHHITYNIASIYALKGTVGEAVKWLRTTAETGFPNYLLFARDPHLDRIRENPEFIRFMSELKVRWEGFKREFE
jgi:DNA-binding winged helix-turn-helix (wHTH) protein/TolB-like protein